MGRNAEQTPLAQKNNAQSLRMPTNSVALLAE